GDEFVLEAQEFSSVDHSVLFPSHWSVWVHFKWADDDDVFCGRFYCAISPAAILEDRIWNRRRAVAGAGADGQPFADGVHGSVRKGSSEQLVPRAAAAVHA